MRNHLIHLSQKAQNNWKSGLTVSLVSLPLSVSLAVASNATPTMGIITAIWAGLFAAVFGGSHYNVVGPTGALSGLLAIYASTHGAPALATLAVVSGFLVLLSWQFRLERFIKKIPEHTIQGFTVGVAFIIAATQLGGALGIKLPENVTEQFAKITYFFAHLNETILPTFFIFAIFLALLFLFKKLTPKFPGAIILSPFGIGLGALSVKGILPFHLMTLGEKYANMTPQLFLAPHLAMDVSIIIPALGVALIAIIETGISAEIADRATKTTHNPRKEIFGLGLANLASGFMGGIPATAALARTSLNIKSGADHKMSGTINALCIIAISFVFLSYFTYIPMAVIAAILTYTAVGLIEVETLKHVWKYDRIEMVIITIIATICIVQDTVWGIGFGIAITLFERYFRLAPK